MLGLRVDHPRSQTAFARFTLIGLCAALLGCERPGPVMVAGRTETVVGNEPAGPDQTELDSDISEEAIAELRASWPVDEERVVDAAPDEFHALNRAHHGTRATRTFFGKASYYSDALEGRSMANGEPYQPNRPTAAHRRLPFGTVVRVVSLASKRSVIVRIADRGPFAGRGRVIDLSRRAAEALHMIEAGVVPVRVEVLSLPKPRR